MKIRRAGERGHADHGWLRTFHTFSFANYHDPSHMGFRSLRVINEDRVAPGAGFPSHSHRDMEIVTIVLEGALAHSDSIGNGSIIRPGEIQKMSAGTGVVHSEMNASTTEPVHFLQIWIVPERNGIEPMYQQEKTGLEESPGELRLLGAPESEDGSVTIHQDVRLWGARLDGESVTHELAPGRAGWLHLALGSAAVNGVELVAGDGAAIDQAGSLTLSSEREAMVLLFDLG